MSLVNLHMKNLKPKYNNILEWQRASPDHVYIGRKGSIFINGKREWYDSSIWANPFKGDSCIEKYKEYIKARLETEPELRSQLKELKGKYLGCWCAPGPCHGSVLIELLN